ncbi:MAG: allantoinase AllB [bacterium]|nr:allantoinase AllB [bacterium]
MFDLILKNGMAVTPQGVILADVCVKDEKVADIIPCGKCVAAAHVVDIGRKYLFPGVVDPHVHFNDPGLPEREDLRSGTMSAAAGGVTTVIDMPLSGNPTITSSGAFEQKKNAVIERAIVDCALWGGLINDNTENMAEMAASGACAFKAFTCYAGDDFPYVTRDVLLKGMQKAAEYDLLIGVHCEDEEAVGMLERDAKVSGRNGVKDFLKAHPPLSEERAVEMVLEAAEISGARAHICHASIPNVVEKVSAARRRGVKVTVETCPHYLIFTEDDLEKQQGILKCTPPVRKQEDVEGMWNMLLSGKIDILGSDHSPSTMSQKISSSSNFWDIWGGINGVQTLLPLLFYHGVVKRGLRVEDLVQLTSTKAAQIFGLWPQKGAIEIGCDADFAVFDPAEKWVVSQEKLFYKNKHTPYLGMEIIGKVVMTFVRGKCVFDNGVINLIHGKFLNCH